MYFLFLYCSLASPEWSEREAASAAMLHLIDRHPTIYGPRLAEWAKGATEPEVRARVRVPLACYYRWRANSFVPTTTPVWPIVDAFPVPTQWGDVRFKGMTCWMCWGPTTEMDAGPYWWRYRKGTERMVRSMLLEGADPVELDNLVGRMGKLEQAASGDCGDKFAESAGWTRWSGGYPTPRIEP